MLASQEIYVQRKKKPVVHAQGSMKETGLFPSLFPSPSRMRSQTYYLVSCLLLTSFLFGATEACWGVTAPNYAEMTNDYDLLVGSDLVLTCTLKRTNFSKEYGRFVSSSDLVIEKDKKDFSKFSKKISNMTLELRIPKAKENDTGLYLCQIFINSTTKPVVCGSKVSVGYPSHHVSNFSCINRNYESLNCTWKIEENNVSTKYTVVKYMLNSLPEVCPNKTENSCEWSSKSGGFLNLDRNLSFTVTGTNSLGNSTDNFTYNSFEIVIPNSPENLNAINVGRQSITVRWNRPTMRTFEIVPLQFQIWLSKLEYNSSDILIYDAGNSSIQNNALHFTIDKLIPCISYNVSIRCRSLYAKNEDMWSSFTSINVKTLADVPYKTPEIIPEAYELHSYEETRSVSLFWKTVPELFHNGKQFHYHIKYSQNLLEGTSNVSSVNSTISFVNIRNLQKHILYTFHIHSANENGISQKYETIFIPPEEEIPPAPSDVRVILQDLGVYNLSWNPPNDVDAFNYTVFWCESLKPWMSRCDSSIQWFHESLPYTNIILNLTDRKTNFQFAVVSQTESRSSGMQWASCIVPEKGGIGKIKYVVVEQKTSTSLKVIWKLDCPAQKAVVKRYEIVYCAVHRNEKCNVAEVDANSENFILENLHPFSNYSVKIRAVNNENNKRENSDAVFQTTASGAPSGPPRNIKVYPNSSSSFIISWIPPAEPNGNITKYVIYYNGSTKEDNTASSSNEYSFEVVGLRPYSMYAVQIAACVNSECSDKSEVYMIRTDVDVPGYMEPPRIEEENSTHLKVSWIAPMFPNGPIDLYIIKWQEEDQNETSDAFQTLEVSGVNSVILDVKCPTRTSDGIKYLFYIRSVNVKNGVNLFGPFSKSTQAKPCQMLTETGMYVGIVLGITLSAVIVLLLSYKVYKWIKNKFEQVNGMKIVLPEGLEGPETNPLNNYEYFKNGLNGNIPGNNNERLSYVIDENKNRHGSGSSQFSNSSTEELIFKNGKCIKFGRKPSGDSSGCSSMSSNATPRIQLSSDSGTESDFAIPPSPDSGITEQNIHNPHKPPLPILMEVHDQTFGEKPSPQQAVSPDKQSQKDKSADGMILKVDSPYSKFGIAGSSTSVPWHISSLPLYSSNLTRSEPSVFDAQKPDKSDTIIAPYSKVGLAKSSSDLLGMSSVKQMGYSKFGFSTSQKRFSIPPRNLNSIAMLLLENPDRKEWPNMKKVLADECAHSTMDKKTTVNVPSRELVEDCGYIKFGRSNLHLKKPSHGYVPFNDLKNQMEHNPLSMPHNPTDQMKDMYDYSKTDKDQEEFSCDTDWPSLSNCEEENSNRDIPEVLFEVPFLVNSIDGTAMDDSTCHSNNCSVNLPYSQNSNELLSKVSSESDIKCISDSQTFSEVTNKNNLLLQNKVSSVPDVNVLHLKGNPTSEEAHSGEILNNKTDNYGIPNEVIVNPVTLRNGYVPFHSLTDSICNRTPNNFLKVPESNVSKIVFPNGVCAGADNYLTSTHKGDTKLLKEDPRQTTVSVLPPIQRDSSNNIEKPVQNGNGYSSLSLKYILKPLPKMESEICEV